MDECKVCANADNEYCFACDNGNQFKPITNADRIRSITDEELADELLEWYAVFSVVEWSKEMILDWLKQEAAEGERWTQSNT